ncbi:nucleoside deaminase [Bifidobacterium sp. ESL0704]|uniref:nucleoside deaminase n=1 Tax=Bifidobacterium sp. ESL0704 TaxID=2983219 RepID=UPI0023F8F285|nr:nucleoside deaminase [Bifidobacterium sp. ESL0704]WEV53814.1 nucleoside deaminase [Bifidobacterium sp. ESL0704]
MDAALDLAREAADVGEVPVGAVVLDGDGVVIGRGRNRREADGDPLAHAEVMALREAADSRKSRMNEGAGHARSNDDDSRDDQTMNKFARQNAWNLADCTLVVTLEPCPMCAGAALQTHVGRIVFGAWDAKLGACGSVWDIPRDPHVGARPEVVGGVREAECAQVLADFFVCRRK